MNDSRTPADGSAALAPDGSPTPVGASSGPTSTDPAVAQAGPYNPPARGVQQPNRGATWLLLNVVIPLVILAAAGGVLWWLGVAQPAQLPPEDATATGRLKRLPLAHVMTVQSLDDFGGRLNLSVDGVVVPFREVQLASEVAGQIIFKDPVCEAGNRVQQGQLLFRIDPTDYRFEVERLARLRDQEYQALKELDQETANAQRLLAVTTQELELRQRELERLRALPEGFASQSELDQAEQIRLQALQAQVTAQNQRDLLQRRRSRLEAAERLAATQLEAAEVNLQRTEIRAPIAGVIVREDAELNSYIERGMPVITIEDTSAAEVAVSLRMDQLYWVLDQQRSSSPDAVENPAGRGYELPATDATIYYEMAGREGAVYQWHGTLMRYSGVGMDEQSRTVPVRVVVDQPRRVGGSQPGQLPGPSALVRGMFVRVVLHIEPRTRLMVIPAVALKPGNRVWRFQPDAEVLAEPLPVAEDEAADLPKMREAKQAADVAVGDSLDSSDGAEDGIADAPETPATVPDGKPFDPTEWVPGRVTVLENVRPIEAVHRDGIGLTAADGGRRRSSRDLATSGETDRGAGSAGTEGTDEQKYWVCEVPPQAIDAGDYAVISPLASVGRGASDAARVPAQQIDPSDVPQALSVAAR